MTSKPQGLRARWFSELARASNASARNGVVIACLRDVHGEVENETGLFRAAIQYGHPEVIEAIIQAVAQPRGHPVSWIIAALRGRHQRTEPQEGALDRSDAAIKAMAGL